MLLGQVLLCVPISSSAPLPKYPGYEVFPPSKIAVGDADKKGML